LIALAAGSLIAALIGSITSAVGFAAIGDFGRQLLMVAGALTRARGMGKDVIGGRRSSRQEELPSRTWGRSLSSIIFRCDIAGHSLDS